MKDHFLNMLLFSLIISIIFSLLFKKEKEGRLKFGIIVFVSFILFALVVSWIMFPFSR